MVKFGMSPMDAIKSATTKAAICWNERRTRVIAPGAYADIIAVRGDPLAKLTRSRTRSLS